MYAYGVGETVCGGNSGSEVAVKLHSQAKQAPYDAKVHIIVCSA